LTAYTRSILIFAGINVIAAYSFFAPFKTGQVSLGQAGFMAVGAYASGDPDAEIRRAVRRRAAAGGHRRRQSLVSRRLPGAAHPRQSICCC
jgi:hypothetical protein